MLKVVFLNVCKAPAKRSQHANATYRNIVGRNMLPAFGHPVATCWAQHVVGSNLTIFKREPTTPTMSQHIATRWPNAPNMLRPTMLRYVASACCDRLAGALIAHFHVFVALQPPYVMDRWKNSTAGAPIIVECTVNYEVHCCKHKPILMKEIINLSEGTIVFFSFVSERSSL